MTVEDNLTTWTRVWIGSSGGAATAIVKYLGQDHSRVSEFFLAGQFTHATNLGLGYLVMVPLLMILGALVAMYSSDTDRWQLFIRSLAAPALLTTLAGGSPAASQTAYILPAVVSTAYADERQTPPVPGVSVWEGLKLFFNVDTGHRYRVIAGSFKSKTEAQELAGKINAEDPKIGAFVGERRPGNEYYPVVVSEYVPLSRALAIQQRVLKKVSVGDAYLSSYPH